MSAYQIDIPRLLADQQRMQRDLAVGEERYKRTLEQSEMLMTANHSLRQEKEQLEQQHRAAFELALAVQREQFGRKIEAMQEEQKQLAAAVEEASKQ